MPGKWQRKMCLPAFFQRPTEQKQSHLCCARMTSTNVRYESASSWENHKISQDILGKVGMVYLYMFIHLIYVDIIHTEYSKLDLPFSECQKGEDPTVPSGTQLAPRECDRCKWGPKLWSQDVKVPALGEQLPLLKGST